MGEPIDIIHDDLLLELVYDLLKAGQGATFMARGTSMAPLIPDGARITVQPVKADELRPGAVALYLADLPTGGVGMVVHRLLGSGQLGLLFKGDACPLPDPEVRPEKVVARVTRVEHEGKSLSLDSWLGRRRLTGAYLLPRLSAGWKHFVLRHTERLTPPYLPVSSGRLLRERDLIQLCLGPDAVHDELGAMDALLRLQHDETELLPLILHQVEALDSRGDAALPPETEAHLIEAKRRNQKERAACRWLEETLKSAHLQTLLVGDAALAFHIYPAPYTRRVDLLQILLPANTLAPITDLLLATGCALTTPEIHLSTQLTRGEVRLRPPDPSWPEVGLATVPAAPELWRRRLRPEGFWDRPEPSRFGDAILLPSREGLFLLRLSEAALALPHLRLRWAIDLAFIALCDMDWDRLTALIVDQQLLLPAGVVLRWFSDHVPSLVPKPILVQIDEQLRRGLQRREIKALRHPTFSA